MLSLCDTQAKPAALSTVKSRDNLTKMIRTTGIEPGTIRYLRILQSNALPTELCSEIDTLIEVK